MSAVFEMQIDSETLEPQELKKICGHSRSADQIAWLRAKGWQHEINAANAPVVGRWYARMKLAGVDVSTPILGSALPDFSKVV